ncbi:MAG TPA: DUF3617 domain-containing protein [Rhodocyclaceae bacterium]|nr:DUF3617 domain-containing protein [Rhodocyclaceae bacterium]
MKKSALAVLIALCGTAYADNPGLKAGLWEVTVVRQVMDGRDMTSQMAAAQAQMQQAMAKMSPAQRKQMEAMMGSKGGGQGSGAVRICVSPAMAARDKPMVDPEGRCEPAKVSRSGNKTSFEFNCTTGGRTSVGKGETVASGDSMTTHMDMTTTGAEGRHTMQTDSQMKYLGSDCQGVKPADQLAKEMGAMGGAGRMGR